VWIIEYYETEQGEKPAYNFIEELPLKLKAKVAMEISLLEEFGTQIKMPYSRAMQDGIFELRIKLSNNTARIFYFFIVNKKIILTNGFMKKTQKTPQSELKKALLYKADYERKYIL
jgi:phage-related protein